MKRDGSVYFPVLESELAERGVTKKRIQKLIEVDYSTLVTKINGDRPFLLREAIAIQETYFPDISVNELFRHK